MKRLFLRVESAHIARWNPEFSAVVAQPLASRFCVPYIKVDSDSPALALIDKKAECKILKAFGVGKAHFLLAALLLNQYHLAQLGGCV